MPEDSTGAADAPEPTPTSPPIPTPATPAEPSPAPAPAQEPDLKAEVERLAREARKWEDRAKANNSASKELEALRQQSMTDQERAVAEAKAAGRSEATAVFAAQLIDAKIEAVAAGRIEPVQLALLLQTLNRSVFLLEDGTVDEKSIQTWVNGLVPKAPVEESPKSPQFPDLGQGVRGASPVALNSDPLLAALKRAVGAP